MSRLSTAHISFGQNSAPLGASIIVFLIGISVLFGWTLEIDFLKRIVPGYVFMSPVSAIAFILLSISLWLLQRTDVKSIRLAQACAALVALVGFIKLCAIVGFFDIGIDRILFSEQLFDRITQKPNQIAPNAALNFLLLGVALLLLNTGRKRVRGFFPSQYLVIAVLLSSFLALTGYVYGVKSFYVIVSFNPMAIHTAFSFFVLAVGLLLSRPEDGLIGEVVSNHTGGEMARRLIPVVFIVPVLLGWFRLTGERFGFYESEMGVAMFVVSVSIILGSVILINARLMNKASIRRKKIEADVFRLASIVESSDDAIISLDFDATITSWNAAATRIFGYMANEMVGQSIYHIIPPERHNEEPQIIEQIKRGERLGDFETVRIGKDGRQIPVSLTVSPIYDNECNIIGISKILHDITKRKKSEEELQKARNSAIETARLKSEFLANMSHEIRTPMNGVIGMTELLLQTRLHKEQRDYTETIQSSADALLRIIDDILDFSKIESGQLSFEKIDFDLREWVESSVEVLAEKARVKNIELASLIYTDVPAQLCGDPGRLRQVLTNLIGNAVKFTDKGEVIVSVSTVTETEKHVLLRFEVKDTGIGISPEAQKRLFQPFSQADGSTTRKYGGTGLGLAISNQLVEMMDGEIGADSEPRKGSTFWFTACFEKQPMQIFREKIVSPTNLEDVLVLIVDDNDTNRKILLHQIASWGMVGVEANSGAQALRLLRDAAGKEPFQIAILDLMMPEMDGFELAQTIKADPRISPVRLIILPSYGRRDHRELAREAGISAYLQKPVRQTQLYDCLVSVINQPEINNGSVASNPLVRKHSSPQAALPIGSFKVGASNARILVVEDNIVNQKVTLNQLQSLGYEATAAFNGREAVEEFKQSKYDLVLMDCQMPEMDGFETTNEIRLFEGDSKHTAIIAMTANALDGDRERCLAAGMDDYLSKPVKAETLRRMLKSWLVGFNEQVKTFPEKSDVISPQNINGAVDLSNLTLLAELQKPGDNNLINELIDLFIEDTNKRLAILKEAVAKAETTTINRQAHSLKGSAGNIGARQMAAVCRELEQKADNISEAETLISEVEREFEQAVKFFNQWKAK